MNVLIYRCRRCGDEEEFPIDDNIELVLSEIVADGESDVHSVDGDTYVYSWQEVHTCPTGGLGISDLIGAKRSESSEGSK